MEIAPTIADGLARQLTPEGQRGTRGSGSAGSSGLPQRMAGRARGTPGAGR